MFRGIIGSGLGFRVWALECRDPLRIVPICSMVQDTPKLSV